MEYLLLLYKYIEKGKMGNIVGVLFVLLFSRYQIDPKVQITQNHTLTIFKENQ